MSKEGQAAVYPILHNPIAEMYGPYFLVFYPLVALAALAFILTRRAGLEAQRTALQIAEGPDPYEIAYLRGGENEVIRTATVSLLSRGWLDMTTSRRIVTFRAATDPNRSDAPEIERLVLQACAYGKRSDELFSSALPARMSAACQPYHAALVDRGMLFDEQRRRTMIRTSTGVTIAVIALGVYKLFAAVANGHDNILFLLFEIPVLGVIVSAPARKMRVTQAGQEYIRRVQQAYSGLRSAANTDLGEQRALLLAAAFGVGALADTPHAAYGAAFRQAGSSSGCGSSCGSSCGGGGGGGCGGGGGGCGGCGGGG